MLKKRGLIIVFISLMIANFIYAEDFGVSIDVPSSIDVNEVFDVNINLDVTGDISNSVLVGVTIFEDLKIISAEPDKGLIVGNTIMWILEPVDTSLSFKAKSEVPGEYKIDVRIGTYDRISGSYEEISFDRTLTVGECKIGQVKDYTCPDGTNVTWCVCSDGEFGCIISPENNCPLVECAQQNEYPDEGEICCEGLKQIELPNPYIYDSNTNTCEWSLIDIIFLTPCINCGNNNCEVGEDICNCPQDCEKVTILDIIDVDNSGKIETSELLIAINRWIAGEIDTTIILEGINLWIEE